MTLQTYCEQNIAFVLENTGKDNSEVMIIKSYRKTRKRVSYDKPQEMTSTEEEPVAVEPPPKQTKRAKRKQSTNNSKSIYPLRSLG